MKYHIAVRALCEFTAREGDLDLRFTPAPTAQEGIAGHQIVAARRGPEFVSELSLHGNYSGMEVSGRADGYDRSKNLLEEFKTHRGDVSRIPENHQALHWAQLKVYGWLLCAEYELSETNLSLVYFNIATQHETAHTVCVSAANLQDFFELQCTRFLAWAKQEDRHRRERDASLKLMCFPWEEFRQGQRQLAVAVYRAARDGTSLMAQATTGIGKTLATLFPQLKAFPDQQLDRLFFLTAKTPGRRPALEALKLLCSQQTDMPLRVLEHVARDKACVYPDRACHGESCPLAKGFYDRLPAARHAALAHRWLTHTAVREIALTFDICPYYLSQELCRWADVVVADYNYYFDMSALLHGLTVLNNWRTTLLVDEAHNLIERARSMYSAHLHQDSFQALRKVAPTPLKSALSKVSRQWNKLRTTQDTDYQVYASTPDLFVISLQQAVSAITDYLSDQPLSNDPLLQRFYLDALLFCRLSESFGPQSLFDITLQHRGSKTLANLCLRNIIPAPFLTPRFANAHSTTLFSATLSPQRYYVDLLGLPEQTQWLDIDSPFSADQLQVKFVGNLSTRFQDRQQSLGPITELMGSQFRHRPGNYLAFFSSYAYLQQALEAFRKAWPGIPVREQTSRMGETERQEFLDGFTENSCCIGFVVLGGAFGEGIDLPGKRLIGAFIATLGLPQMNPVTEELKRRMHQLFGRGYDYAYLYPGLQKVVQAAGRVIRAPTDEGFIWLLDDRFGQHAIRELIPSWWHLQPYWLETTCFTQSRQDIARQLPAINFPDVCD